MKSIQKITEGEVVAIDGKTLCSSYDKASEQSAIVRVSAWATTNRLVLGQVKVDEKSNEITAIPELLKVLELSGAYCSLLKSLFGEKAKFYNGIFTLMN